MCFMLLGGHFESKGDTVWSAAASKAVPVVQLSCRPSPALGMLLCSG